MLIFYYYNLRYYFKTKFVSKLIWVINNFLTMECYRKLCNKLYWKKLTPGTLTYKTRFWLIVLSAISAIWLAFFFDPTDPANLNSPSRFITLSKKLFNFITFHIRQFIIKLTDSTGNNGYQFSYVVLRSHNILLWQSQERYLRASSLLI